MPKPQSPRLLPRAFSLVLAVVFSAGFAVSAFGQVPDNPFRGKPPLVPPPANTPNPFPEPSLDAATVAVLDPLLEKKDWLGLRKAVQKFGDKDAFSASMDWLKVHTDTGASFIVPLLYSENLWLVGNAAQVQGLKAQAAFMVWYVVALIRMDGLACGDATAPTKRLEQVIAGPAGAALRYSASLEPGMRAKMIQLAVGLEAETATRRAPQDEALLSGRLRGIGSRNESQKFRCEELRNPSR